MPRASVRWRHFGLGCLFGGVLVALSVLALAVIVMMVRPPEASESMALPTLVPPPAPPRIRPSTPDAIDSYLAWLLPKLDMVDRGIYLFGQEISAAGSDPRLVDDAGWRVRTGNYLGIVKLGAETLRSEPRDVPDIALLLDADIVYFGNEMVATVHNIVEGVAPYNITKANRAAQQLRHTRMVRERIEVQVQDLARNRQAP